MGDHDTINDLREQADIDRALVERYRAADYYGSPDIKALVERLAAVRGLADAAFAPCPRCGTPMNFHQDECEPPENLEWKLGEAEAQVEATERLRLIADETAKRHFAALCDTRVSLRTAREEVKRWKELAAALDGLMAHYKLGTTNTRKAVRAVDRVRDARAALQPTPKAADSPQADPEAREP